MGYIVTYFQTAFNADVVVSGKPLNDLTLLVDGRNDVRPVKHPIQQFTKAYF